MTAAALAFISEPGAYTHRRTTKETLKVKITAEEKQRIINASRDAKAGELFNLDALQSGFAPVFIVRDIITAKLLASFGYEAIGLEDPVNTKDLNKAISDSKPQSVIVSLPWEDGFTDAAEEIGAELKKRKILHAITDAESGGSIDAETVDPEAFAEAAIDELNGAFFRRKNVFNVFSRVTDFFDEIQSADKYPAIKTGFDCFDGTIGGGLYPGLYAIAGEPGAGKTSFVLQIADNIAKTGKAVFIYAAEMSYFELNAKSVSRLTFEKSKNPDPELRKKIKAAGISAEDLAKTTHDILDGTRHKRFSDLEQDVISSCVFEHAESKGLYVIECFDNTTAEDIRKDVEEWKAKNGTAPVVIVDYLQILAPINDRGTDKQNADAAVRVFKSIARECKTPVLCISSLNRSSYDEDNEDGFKDSGGIEYTADITMRLTLPEVFAAGAGKNKDEKAQARKAAKRAEMQKPSRRVGLMIMKSRFENPFQYAEFDFYAKYNCFVPRQNENENENENGIRNMNAEEEEICQEHFAEWEKDDMKDDILSDLRKAQKAAGKAK